MEFLKKNAGAIIFVAILLFVVWYFFMRKKAESSYRASAVGSLRSCPDGCYFSSPTGRCVCPPMRIDTSEGGTGGRPVKFGGKGSAEAQLAGR